MKTYDLTIIGAGLAGLTAAIYARRAGQSVLVIEEKIPGGQIVQASSVHNWPGETEISGEKLGKRVYTQAKSLGTEFEFSALEAVETTGTFETTGAQKTTKTRKTSFTLRTSDSIFHARSLIIATGTRNKPLGLTDEARFLGHGISYCATCDGALYRDKSVAVVGGGNTAFHDALYLANLAHKVYLIHRRNTFRADSALVEKAKRLENIEFILNATPIRLEGDQKLERIILQPSSGTTKIAPETRVETEAKTKARAEIETKAETKTEIETRSLPVSALFVAIGRQPATTLFKNLVALDQDGYIITDENCRTSTSGIFAAGDCRKKSVRQLVTAAADGAIAADSALEFLNET